MIASELNLNDYVEMGEFKGYVNCVTEYGIQIFWYEKGDFGNFHKTQYIHNLKKV